MVVMVVVSAVEMAHTPVVTVVTVLVWALCWTCGKRVMNHLLDVLQVRSVERNVTGFSTARQPAPCGLKSTIIAPASKNKPLNY